MISVGQQPLVSIIIPVFNRVQVLKNTLKSVGRQLYSNLEVLVVDDGSTDDVAAVTSRFAKTVQFPVVYLRQRNRGPAAARFTGLRNCNGEFVQYLDSDNEILPEKIRTQVDLMVQQPDTVMTYTTVLRSHGAETKIRPLSNLPSNDLLLTALRRRHWHTSSCLWRYPDKSIARWEDLFFGEDLVHDVSVGCHNRAIAFVPRALVIDKYVGDNLSDLSWVFQSEDRVQRYISDIRNTNLILYNLLQEHALLQEAGIAELLAERFYHSALKLAKLGSVADARTLLAYVTRLSRQRLRRWEVLAAHGALRLDKGNSPRLYRALFEVHRQVSSSFVHCDRRV